MPMSHNDACLQTAHCRCLALHLDQYKWHTTKLEWSVCTRVHTWMCTHWLDEVKVDEGQACPLS